MTISAYMSGRKKWARPQAMLWSDTPGTLNNGVYVPSGYEVYSNTTGLTPAQITDSFIILPDHNRSELNIGTQRIEQKQRMINGTMRSYHIADKITLSTSWQMLPSRQSAVRANFDQTTGLSSATSDQQYTVDMGAGGAEILKWYEDHKGPFWVFLSYDKYTNFGTDTNAHQHLAQYSQAVQMYFSNFDYNVVKRGATNFDLWNVNISLEEV